jgi:hypothetical protein
MLPGQGRGVCPLHLLLQIGGGESDIFVRFIFADRSYVYVVFVMLVGVDKALEIS